MHLSCFAQIATKSKYHLIVEKAGNLTAVSGRQIDRWSNINIKYQQIFVNTCQHSFSRKPNIFWHRLFHTTEWHFGSIITCYFLISLTTHHSILAIWSLLNGILFGKKMTYRISHLNYCWHLRVQIFRGKGKVARKCPKGIELEEQEKGKVMKIEEQGRLSQR